MGCSGVPTSGPQTFDCFELLSNQPDSSAEEILSPEEIETAVDSLAEEILKTCEERGDIDQVAFVGIYTRGVTLARRVAAALKKSKGSVFPIGTLDISLYRDDLETIGSSLPRLESSDIPFALDDTRVILFDEVIFTGRTIRAALDGLMDYGRPAKVELAVLVDRGKREIPVQPDFAGLTINAAENTYVEVRFQEDDGREGVFLVREKKR